jgi:hypothetical protein
MSGRRWVRHVILQGALITLGFCFVACGAGAPPTRVESAHYGEACASTGDCPGRLRCVAWSDIAGRQRQSCLYECEDGCPEGWVCGDERDGPSGVCRPSN